MYSNNTMLSEVEINQKLVRVDDILIYTDSANCQTWVVTELFKGGFVAKDDYEEKVYFFSELNHGWEFTEKTKKDNTELHHLRYV